MRIIGIAFEDPSKDHTTFSTQKADKARIPKAVMRAARFFDPKKVLGDGSVAPGLVCTALSQHYWLRCIGTETDVAISKTKLNITEQLQPEVFEELKVPVKWGYIYITLHFND